MWKVIRCPHCHSRATIVHCVTCNREMCEDCISYGDEGKVCGLCKDREDSQKRYDRLPQKVRDSISYDDWYDQNA